jgi:hypothetical protein
MSNIVQLERYSFVLVNEYGPGCIRGEPNFVAADAHLCTRRAGVARFKKQGSACRRQTKEGGRKPAVDFNHKRLPNPQVQ